MRSLALATCLLVGCGTTITTTPVNAPPHAMRPRPPATVELYTSGPPTHRPYIDVAFLEAEQMSALSVDQMPEFFAELRAHAAKLGCDAVVIGNTTSGNSVLAKGADVKGVVGTCLVYTDLPASVAQRPD